MLDIILEKAGYSLNEFFIISRSSKNDLLRALNTLVNMVHDSEIVETKSTDTIDFYNAEFPISQDGFANCSKEITPIKMRNSSANSIYERSSKQSARIHSTKLSRQSDYVTNDENTDCSYANKRLGSKEKKIPLMMNNFMYPGQKNPMRQSQRHERPVAQGNGKNNLNHVLVSKNMNLVQQEEPPGIMKAKVGYFLLDSSLLTYWDV